MGFFGPFFAIAHFIVQLMQGFFFLYEQNVKAIELKGCFWLFSKGAWGKKVVFDPPRLHSFLVWASLDSHAKPTDNLN